MHDRPVSLAELARFLAQQPVLALAVAAIFVATLGALVRTRRAQARPAAARVGNLGVVAALLLTVVQVARFTQGADLALPQSACRCSRSPAAKPGSQMQAATGTSG